MPMKFANNVASTLAAPVAPTDATITVNTTAGANAFPALTAGDYFYATLENLQTNTREVVKVTAVAMPQLTVIRAQDGTAAASFGVGDKCELRLVAAVFNDLPKLDEANTFQKLITASLGMLISAGGLTVQAGATSLNGGATVKGGLTVFDTNLTFPDGTALASNLNLGYRNKIRNGRMDLSQRTGPFAAIASGAYSVDGWKRVGAGAQVVTHSQQANSYAASEFQNVLRVACTTANAAPAAGDYETVQQPVEGYLVRDLLGKPIAIQFEVKSPKTGLHSVSLSNSGNDRSYVWTYNVAVANTAQVVTLALPTGLISAGTWNWTTGVGAVLRFCLMAGATWQAAAGAWQAGNYLAAAGQVNCMDAIGNVFEVTGVQVERAPSSSPFEHLDYSLEFHRNQRYYCTGQALFMGSAYAVNLTTGGMIKFPVTMRGVPTIALGAPSENVNTGAISIGPTDSSSFRLYSNANPAAGSVYYTNTYTASAEL